MSHSEGDNEHIATDQERGIALIMSNSFSGIKDMDRKGAAINDYDCMVSLWRDTLGCEMFSESGKDLSAQQMRTALRKFSNIQGHFKYVVVVISTHGGLVKKSFAEHPGQPIANPNNFQIQQKNGYKAFKAYRTKSHEGEHDREPMIPVFLGNDCLPVREKEMKEMFYNDAATGLQDIPKILILDYCRGDMDDYGVIRVPPPTSTKKFIIRDTPTQPPSSTRNHEIQPFSLMPLVSDAIAIYATHEHTSALEYAPEYGSWLISEINRVFAGAEENKDLLELMTEVNKNMKNKTEGVKEEEKGQTKYPKAMSVFESSLTRNVYLK